MLIPLFENGDGGVALLEGQPAFLEFYDRVGLTYLPLEVSLNAQIGDSGRDGVILTPAGAPEDLSFAIGLAGSEDGGVDWSVAPLLFDPQNLQGPKFPYDPSSLVMASSSSEESESDDEDDPSLLEEVADAVVDAIVGVWDGISAGLASAGWGSGGSLATVTDTLNQANGK